MVWNPAIPATNADLLSAPVRDNFAALDTSVMGALGALATQQVLIRTTGPAIGGVAAGANGQVLTLASGAPVWQTPTGLTNPMTNIGDLIRGGTAGVPTRLAAVATGAVLASAGVNTAPTWNTSPSLTSLTLSGLTAGSMLFAGAGGLITQDNANLFFDDTNNNLRLFGGGVGTNGQGVFALGPVNAPPTTSPVDTVQLYISDFDGLAGSAALIMRDERGGFFAFGSPIPSQTKLRIIAGAVEAEMFADSGGTVYLGARTNHPVQILTNNAPRITISANGDVSVNMSNIGGVMKWLVAGAPDSGTVGYRQVVVPN
jgi:hypothetical protein